MRYLIFTLLAISFTTMSFSQISETKYYSNVGFSKEVSQEKAKFSETIIQNTDGTVTNELKDLKKNVIMHSETFKGDEPYGVWKFLTNNSIRTIDYNFPLIYSDEKCDNIPPITTNDFFIDNDSLGYKAPKINMGESTVYQFISKNIIYPSRAKDEGIEGAVYLRLKITKEGAVEDVVVIRGVNVLLDKEAVRVIRQLKFTSPPTIHGQSFTLECMTLPIRFSLN